MSNRSEVACPNNHGPIVAVVPMIHTHSNKYNGTEDRGVSSEQVFVVVVVVMDFMAQVQSHLLSHQYDGLMKKANLTS